VSAHRYWMIQVSDSFDNVQEFVAANRIEMYDASHNRLIDGNTSGVSVSGSVAGSAAAAVESTFRARTTRHCLPSPRRTNTDFQQFQGSGTQACSGVIFQGNDTGDIAAVAIKASSLWYTRSPKDFKVQKSSDGSSWTDVLTRTNEPAWTAGEQRVFSWATAPARRRPVVFICSSTA